MTPARIVPAGDGALVAEFDDRIDAAVNARAIAVATAVRSAGVVGVRDVVPTFRSVAVYFDPLAADVAKLEALLRDIANTAPPADTTGSTLVEIPVCYDREFAIDVDDVARFAGLPSADDVAAIHSSRIYRVFMLGFIPGFAYLGTVDERIAAPRRTSPRREVAAGSVGIAGPQTGIYPQQSPGGWNIIGRTPMRMLSPDRVEPSLLRAGDSVRFRPIDRSGFDRVAREQGQRA
jgi:KipI family sensor histidine kinase inhibitor